MGCVYSFYSFIINTYLSFSDKSFSIFIFALGKYSFAISFIFFPCLSPISNAIKFFLFNKGSSNQDDLDDRILEEIKTISYENMDQLLASGGKLIDVRSQDEYNRSHLKGAINLPYDNINSTMRKENPDKGEKLIVYCSAGKRSMQARNLMVYMGYQNVYILKGHEGLLQTGI